MLKALFFDVFGTVVDWRGSIADELRLWGTRKGIDRDWTLIADHWRGLYQPAMEPIREGKRGYVKLDILHRENLDRLLSEYDLEKTEEADRDFLVKAWHRLLPWPDVVAGLNAMSPHYILAPVSNGNISLMVNLARFGSLPWDTILGSEVALNYKPNEAVYRRSAEALDLKTEECLMVAAHNDDLKAARTFGLRTAFVVRPTEHGPNQTTDLEAEADWDLIADDFNDLATQLGC